MTQTKETSLMGADLYITKLDNKVTRKYPYTIIDGYKLREEMRENLGCYYRDAYNVSNIMWTMEFSYWQTPEQLGWKFTRSGNLTVDGATKFRQYLKDNKWRLYTLLNDHSLLRQYIENNNTTVDNEEGLVAWANYFREKYTTLCKFVDRAIDINSTIGWSV